MLTEMKFNNKRVPIAGTLLIFITCRKKIL
jgi:hypothetical protein